MTNTDIRTLKIFEFNRALSYVSEIIEIERKISKLRKEIPIINAERIDWEQEEGETRKEQEDIKQIVKTLELKFQEINNELEVLERYHIELKKLLLKILEFVMGEESLELTRQEIKPSFLEEYVYLLSEPTLEEGCVVTIGELFKNKADLAILIFESYGREKEDLLIEVVNSDGIEVLLKSFEDYFPMS